MQGYQYLIYGGVFPDPFAEWVKGHVPADVSIAVISPQYGVEHSDPIVSMLRLCRPVGSHTGEVLGFSIAEADGNLRAGCEAGDLLRRDMIENGSQWVFLRRMMPSWASAAGADPLVHFQRYPSFWHWFNNNFYQSDQFGKYSVYRRKAAFSGSDDVAARPCS